MLAVATASIFSIPAWRKFQRDRKYDVQLDQLLTASGVLAQTDFYTRVDRLRSFISENSVHKIDDDFYKIWRDETKVANAVLEHVRRPDQPLAHLECSTRSYLVGHLYEKLGYSVRTVVVFMPADKLPSHTFIEVLNPATKRWEIEDTDYNIYWRRNMNSNAQGAPDTAPRANIVDILKAPESSEPCNGDVCGARVKRDGRPVSETLHPYLKIASILDRAKDFRATIYADAVDPKARYHYDGRFGKFCALIGKNCENGFLPANDFVEK